MTASSSTALARPLRRPRPAAGSSITAAIIVIIVFMGVVASLASISLMLAGPAFVIGFLFITWQWPITGLMIAAATAVSPQDVGGGPVMIALGELSIVLAFPILLIKGSASGRGPRPGPTIFPICAYLTVCVLSSLLHWHGFNSMASLGQMVIYLIIAPLVFAYVPKPNESMFPVLCAYIASASLLGTCVIVTGSPYLFGIHKNNVGSSLSCAVIIGAELFLHFEKRRRPWPLTVSLVVLLVALVLSASRGAWMGAAGGISLLLVMRGQLRLALKLAILLLPLIALGWWLMPEDRKTYVTANSGDSVVMRQRSIEFAWAQFAQQPLLGAGLGLRKEYDATNVVLSLLAETGVLGLFAFVWIHLSFIKMAWTAKKRIDISSTTFSLLAIGMALVVAKFLHGCVDHYWSRGSLAMIWGGAGFATAAYLQSRPKPKPR